MELRDALADALRDPSLALAYWLPERDEWVDARGDVVTLPDDPSRCTPVERGDHPIAMLIHDPSLAEEPELVQAVGGAAALALENERLTAELRATVSELRASRARIVESADAARRKIERDLHDGAQQRLVALALELRMARGRVDQDGEAAKELLDGALRNLEEATRELRELARGIHPAVLSDRGLGSALEALAQRMPLPIEITSVPDRAAAGAGRGGGVLRRRRGDHERRALRARRRTRRSTCAATNGALVVEVADDGIGGADPGNGLGAARAQRPDRGAGRAARGLLARRGGTTVRAVIPALTSCRSGR